MSKIWSDAPIESASEDSFGRSAYAKQIAELIQGAHSWKDSIVFGLTGPWGSGKTSMLAMIEGEIKASGNSWHTTRFTPWATSDVSGLLGDFYAALSDVLPSENGRNLRRKLGAILQIAAPAANLIPLAGETVSAAAEKAGDALRTQPSWDKAFQEASDELKELKTPVLVIADDIDRLHGQELLALLKVVRLLGRFPGVHFLLAYDEQTVTETISETAIAGRGAAAGRKFLEKIVQYPLAIPPLVPTQLLDRINDGLAPLLDSLEQREVFKFRFLKLRRILLSQLSTPRAIDRYIAQVRHHLALFDSQEVQVGDVIVLTLVKISFPHLYNQLPRFKDQLLTGMEDGMGRGFHDTERQSFDWEPLLEGLPSEDRSDARTLIEELFPRIKRRSFSHLSLSEERGVNDRRYFDRYFAMGVPAHDIADTVVADSVKDAVAGDGKSLKKLLIDEDPNLIVIAIEKAETHTDLFVEDAERLAVLRIVLPLLRMLPRHDTVLISADLRIREWSGKLLSQISDGVERQELIEILSLSPHHLDQVQIIRFMLMHNGKSRWVDSVLDYVCENISEVILSNLKAQDQAGLNDEVNFMIFVLGEWNRQELLVPRLQTGLARGDFSVEDVAARCVSCLTSSASGQPVTKLDEFGKDAFDELVPDADNSWFSVPRPEVDVKEIGWKSRRNFAVMKAREKVESD